MKQHEADLEYVRSMLELATKQRDPVGVDWWSMEEIRLSNPTRYEIARARRAAELHDEGERRGA